MKFRLIMFFFSQIFIDFTHTSSKKKKSSLDVYLEKADKHATLIERNDEKIIKMLQDNLKKRTSVSKEKKN